MSPPQPILTSEVGWWLWIHGVEDVSTRIWIYELIDAMDRERCKDWAPKEENDGEGSSKGKPPAHDAKAASKHRLPRTHKT